MENPRPTSCSEFDMRNAVGTGLTDRLLDAHQVRADDDHFEDMFYQKRTRATVIIDPSDAMLGVRPQSGGRMGDGDEPELFMECFYPLITEWDRELADIIGDGLAATSPITGNSCRVDMGAFLYDIIRILTHCGKPSPLTAWMNFCSTPNCKKGGHGQNVDKQEAVVRLSTIPAAKKAE
ncbi:unnamed protein product [Prorocentrum cordatum]|uniref:Uncharacterized protein n=1 Tax=Prorocentrum cordatum TaxID=2364126 RepID=A0ABN9QL67_9DINO|nr:unnamed protein product [Polarella glacialis]